MHELDSLTNFELFHRLWSKAVDSPGYDKREWVALEQRLIRINFLRYKDPAE